MLSAHQFLLSGTKFSAMFSPVAWELLELDAGLSESSASGAAKFGNWTNLIRKDPYFRQPGRRPFQHLDGVKFAQGLRGLDHSRKSFALIQPYLVSAVFRNRCQAAADYSGGQLEGSS
jgi:hypothetical protein